MDDRYHRQTILPEIGKDGQARLAHIKVAVVGTGALGSVSAEMLTRMGVGSLTLIDRDVVDLSNLTRQVLFTEQDARESIPKALAAEKRLGEINSRINIRTHVTDLSWRNASELLDGHDIWIDGTDNFETRFLLNELSIKTKTPWVYGGAIGTRGMAALFRPEKTPCFSCIVHTLPKAEETPTCDTAGVMAPIIHWVASLQVTLLIQHMLSSSETPPSDLWALDIWRGRVDRFPMEELRAPGRCTVCEEKQFTFLEGKAGTHAKTLCGRNAVQLSSGDRTVDIERLGRELSKIGRVTQFSSMLKFNGEGNEILFFEDGRAIVQGTTDPDRAKTLLARYVAR